MIWIIVFFSLALIFTVWTAWVGRGSYYAVSNTVFALIISFTCAFVLAGIGNAVASAFVDSKWIHRGTTNIKNISDTSKTSGSFFLGTGSVDSEPVFWYYVDLGTHAELRQAYADMSLIVEDDGHPRVVEEKMVSTNNFWSVFPGMSDYETRYVFYVPEGAITNEFNLDAKP